MTPGILPSLANSRKQILQRPKSLINPLPRPHLKHRFVALVENFGTLRALAFTDVFAMVITSKSGAFRCWKGKCSRHRTTKYASSPIYPSA